MIDNKNSPAFPNLELKEMGDKFLLDYADSSVTKREYFAGLAMQGLLAGRWASEASVDCNPETIACIAVEQADALLAELSKS